MARYIDADRFRSAMWYSFGESDSYIERGMAKWDSGLWLRYKAVEEVLEAQPVADVDPVAFKGFAEWVASEVCNEDFEDMWSLGAFAEVACRKLYGLCVVKKFNDKWVYVDRKEKDEVEE